MGAVEMPWGRCTCPGARSIRKAWSFLPGRRAGHRLACALQRSRVRSSARREGRS